MTQKNMTQKKQPRFLTTNQVAEILQVTKRTIFRYIKSGKLKAKKIGQWRILKSDLDKFINKYE